VRHPQIWILVVVAMTISISSRVTNRSTAPPQPPNRGTAAQIVWSVYLTQFAGVLEALYLWYPASFDGTS